MSRFALEQLFMHGHIVTPAALLASGLLDEPEGKREPAAKPETEVLSAKRREHLDRRGHLAHA